MCSIAAETKNFHLTFMVVIGLRHSENSLVTLEKSDTEKKVNVFG